MVPGIKWRLGKCNKEMAFALSFLNNNLNVVSEHYIDINPSVRCTSMVDLCKQITKQAKAEMFYGKGYCSGYHVFVGLTYQLQTEIPNYATIKFIGLGGVESTWYTYNGNEWSQK